MQKKIIAITKKTKFEKLNQNFDVTKTKITFYNFSISFFLAFKSFIKLATSV